MAFLKGGYVEDIIITTYDG